MIDKPSRPVDSSYLLELELQRWGYTSGKEFISQEPKHLATGRSRSLQE